MMLNAIDKQVLKEVADLEGIPKGAYNIRKNGKLEGREVSANINIETNEKGDGIIIDWDRGFNSQPFSGIFSQPISRVVIQPLIF